ncbi:PQQ-dependent sugar dehydrogenase [Pedobacter ginsengisoli]|uniref:PQQ-dependent sugar dehydrogenase n=1 Tax=Pedobacter ginsengisoli TaxID=363852 RepID=UPI00254C3EC0|nr:PQQ-dependent sugar dehydrogenase [Pedobacter ginsengisoli]
MNKKVVFSALLVIFSFALSYGQNSAPAIKIDVRLISDQLAYPTAFAEPKDRSGRLFVSEQKGKIRIISKGVLLERPFLDITEDVLMMNSGDEMGLLGFAFHPLFAKNGKFYVFFSKRVARKPGLDHRSVIREYSVSKTDPNLADKTTAREVMSYDEPESNHNGGDIKFGPDGFLYIGIGDGGAYNDLHGEFGNGQNLNVVFGKILRIDIDKPPYGIPADNPFVGKENTRPEIFAYGFRNPWRISFDKVDGRLFAGDVGQKNWEEIDLVTKGGNYGWRLREGTHVKTPGDPDPKNWINPIIDYGRQEGISVTGGYVYRGKQIPSLYGKYIFGDLMGPVWALTDVKKELWSKEKLSISRDPGSWQIYSFGEDQAGELYILSVLMESGKGALYKIVAGK